MLTKDLDEIKSFNAKMVSADVFEQKKPNFIINLWKEAKNIEITLDFLSSDSVIGSFLKKFKV